MTRKTLLILAALVAGLLLLLTISERLDRGMTSTGGTLLFDGFSGRANSIQEIRMLFPGDKPGFTIRRDNDEWVVSARDDYQADVGKLGQLVSALAQARIVEHATSNPERYKQINVDDPEQGGSGSKLFFTGDGFSYELIVGKNAQRDYSYVRVAGDPASYLIDQKLDIADDPSDWLVTDILDIPADRVHRVSISHADGETLVVEKSSRGDSNFTVLDLPAGRNLSYPSAANGIGGALSALTLENVRRRTDGEADVTTVFETWNGLRVTVDVTSADDTSWLSFSAAAEEADTAAEDEPGVAPNDESAAANEESAATDDKVADTGPDAATEADEINRRLGNWQYAIADYKKNLIVRRWDDILAKDEQK